MTPAQAIQRIKPGDRITAARIGFRHGSRCDVGSVTGRAVVVRLYDRPEIIINFGVRCGTAFVVDAENILSAPRIRFSRGSIYA